MTHRVAALDVQADASTVVRCVRAHELSEADLAAWSALDAVALEPNAYLSPQFVLPALRYLDAGVQVDLMFVESAAGAGRRLISVVPVRAAPADRLMPLRHAEVHLSMHSFLGGVLVSRASPERDLQLLYDTWRRLYPHAVVLPLARRCGPTVQLLSAAARRRGMLVEQRDGFERAVMRPREAGEEELLRRLPSRMKKIGRQRKKLAEHGALRLEIHRGRAIGEAVVERHLAIEHLGWKGEGGTSMRSDPNQERFFREMCAQFARDDRGIFVELYAGEHLVHSGSNLTAGDAGFGFKVAYDPRFASLAPGYIGEIELLCRAPQALADIASFDSGATGASFIDELWPLREPMATLVFSTSWLGNLALSAAGAARAGRRWVASMRPPRHAAASPAELAARKLATGA